LAQHIRATHDLEYASENSWRKTFMMAGVAGIYPDKYNKMCGDVNNAIATFMPGEAGTSSKTRMSMVIPGDVSEAVTKAVSSIAMGVGGMGGAGMGESAMGGIGSLADAGVNGDSLVAHMSPDTFDSLGANNPPNPMTGLPQANGGGFGGGDTTDTSGDPSMDDPLAGDDPHGYGQETSNTGRDNSGWGGPTDITDITNVPDLATRSLAYDMGVGTKDLAKMAELMGVTQSQAIDRVLDARNAPNPTPGQLSLNAYTEQGFQQANPNMSAAVTGLGRTALALSPVPGVGAFVGLAERTKGFTDLSGLNPFGSGPPPSAPPSMAEVAAAMAAEQAAGTGPGMDIGPGSGTEEVDLASTEGDFTKAELSAIVENYGSLTNFEAAFKKEFNRDLIPADMLDPAVLEFLNAPTLEENL
jgi:hypothetical protein